MVIKGQHHSVMLSHKTSKEFNKAIFALNITKSEFLRELITAYLEGRVTVENPKEHKFNIKEK